MRDVAKENEELRQRVEMQETELARLKENMQFIQTTIIAARQRLETRRQRSWQ